MDKIESIRFIAVIGEAERLLRVANVHGAEVMLKQIGEKPMGEGFNLLVACVALLAERTKG